ncbi:MAG: prepilin peptidase [Lachnospiraceae bacterium]|nr:prepilin peptidase [Lachnospiraceae bacterium]
MYREIQVISLTAIAMTAVLCDLWSGRIPNAVIAVGLAMGLVCRFFAEGAIGVILSLGGMCLPVLFFGVLYYFRMMGAGDIKLLCVAGGFLGPTGVLSCILRTLFVAAAFSLVILYRNHSLGKRLDYLRRYVCDYAESGKWQPYMEQAGEDAKFCFSVPVLIGILMGI